jgi:hypothetical protein
MNQAVSYGAAPGEQAFLKLWQRREVRDFLFHFKVCSRPAEDYKQQKKQPAS